MKQLQRYWLTGSDRKAIIQSTDQQGHIGAYTIIGVVKNFNFETLHQDVGPLAFTLDGGGFASFKVDTSNINQLIAQIQNKWKSMAPGSAVQLSLFR